MTEPRKTIVEQFDAAETGEDFAAVLNNLFGALDKARDDDDE